MSAELPVIQGGRGILGYVSQEEEEILQEMRRLRSQAEEVRSRLNEDDGEPTERSRLQARLEALRQEWKALDGKREAANRRKLIRLGHLDP